MGKKKKRKQLKLKINVDNITTEFPVNKNNIKKLIRLVLTEEKHQHGEIGVVFVDHDYIIELNKKFLRKNCTTDVLSFPLNDLDSSIITGEIYINLHRVAEQASEYNVTFVEEMNRIIIHGLLHLLDYNDQTTAEKARMIKMEDQYLKISKQRGVF